MPELTFLLCVVRWMISQDENYVENRAKFQLWKQILKLSYHMTAEATIYNLSTRQIMRPLAKLIAYPIGGFNAWRRKPEVLFVIIHPNNRATILSRTSPESGMIRKREIEISETGDVTLLAEKQYNRPRLATQAQINHLELKLRNQESRAARINRLMRHITSVRPTPRLHQMINNATAEVNKFEKKVIEP